MIKTTTRHKPTTLAMLAKQRFKQPEYAGPCWHNQHPARLAAIVKRTCKANGWLFGDAVAVGNAECGHLACYWPVTHATIGPVGDDATKLAVGYYTGDDRDRNTRLYMGLVGPGFGVVTHRIRLGEPLSFTGYAKQLEKAATKLNNARFESTVELMELMRRAPVTIPQGAMDLMGFATSRLIGWGALRCASARWDSPKMRHSLWGLAIAASAAIDRRTAFKQMDGRYAILRMLQKQLVANKSVRKGA